MNERNKKPMTDELPMLKNEWPYETRMFDLAAVKEDFLSVVSKLPGEVPYLRLALIEGRIDGSVYYGECACLKGTLARKAAGFTFNTVNWAVLYIVCALGMRCSVADSQAEQFFYHITKGDTPATNPYSAVVLDWLDEFLVGERVGKPQLVATIEG
jgi:hypothetical protein